MGSYRFHDREPSDHRRLSEQSAASDRPFTPPVDRDAIFRSLICDELQHGRLNKARRARVVRYACGMGLSARQAGELVRECAELVAGESDGRIRERALRIAEDSQAHHERQPALILGAAVMIILIVILLLIA